MVWGCAGRAGMMTPVINHTRPAIGPSARWAPPGAVGQQPNPHGLRPTTVEAWFRPSNSVIMRFPSVRVESAGLEAGGQPRDRDRVHRARLSRDTSHIAPQSGGAEPADPTLSPSVRQQNQDPSCRRLYQVDFVLAGWR